MQNFMFTRFKLDLMYKYVNVFGCVVLHIRSAEVLKLGLFTFVLWK